MRKIFTALIALSVAVQPVQAASPSFDCTTNRSLLERLICSDPELSKLDAEMSGAYWTAVRRAGQKNALALRADQRAYNKHSLQGVEYRLNEASPDAPPQSGAGDSQDHVYGREAAIGALKWRMTGRIKVLKAFEPVRDGYEGQWRSQSGQLHIKKTPAGFKVSASTSTFDWSRYRCEVDGTGHLEGASMVVDALGVNEEPRQLRLTPTRAGLRSELLEIGDGHFFCRRGGELDHTMYFIPVRADLADAEKSKR
jgi:uncharacterized protein YecT (DUF1311 family)